MCDVSVIIPTANHPKNLARALRSLATVGTGHLPFEVIVVDNAPNGTTFQIVQDIARNGSELRVHYHREFTPGLVAGRHRGGVEATSGLLLYLDDDVRVDLGWLAAVKEAFENPEVHLVGGPILPEYEGNPPRWLDGFWHRAADGDAMCGYLSLLDFGGQIKEIDPS